MGTIIDPILYPQEWDYIFIGQVKSPGVIVKISGFGRKYDWDVKKGKGVAGATKTFTGKPPALGTITWNFWAVGQVPQWEEFQKLLKYDPTKKTVSAVDIYHPSLVSTDVLSVVTEEISPVLPLGGSLYEVSVEFGEYLPAEKKNATGTPDGSKTTPKGTTPGVPADPIADAQQKQIADLLKQASEP